MIPPKLPGPTELGPLLKKLEGHPGSVVLIAIDQPETCNFARCTAAWLSREERKVLKANLEKARKKREQQSMQATKQTDPATGEPLPNPKPDPRIPDDWPPKPPPHP